MRRAIKAAAMATMMSSTGITAHHAIAQTGAAYPTKAVRYVIPDTAGGGSDVIGRLIAEGLSETFGQQVIVDNRPGAGTTIGIGYVAKSPPDGYTILQNGSGFAAGPSLYRNLPYDPQRDFIPVIMLAKSPSVVVVHPSLPVHTLNVLIALAKAKPGALHYASAGTGGATFFAGELFKLRTGVDLTHVPYRGGGPALTAVLSGEAPVYFAPVAASLPHLNTRLRPLAVTTLQRLPLLPALPTVVEMGYPGYEAGNWYGLLVPTGTPADIVNTIHRAAQAALNRSSKRLAELAYIVTGSRSEEYAAYIATEMKNVAAIYQRLGLKAN